MEEVASLVSTSVVQAKASQDNSIRAEVRSAHRASDDQENHARDDQVKIDVNDSIVDFCPSCFATSESGSWNHVVVDHYCNNCGSSSIIRVPLFAAVEIRRNASWVGKRYYPADEDRELARELALLRGKMTAYHGRSAQLHEGVGWIERIFIVTQKLPGNRSVSVFIDAESESQAIEKTRTSLPYVEPEL